MPPLTERTKKVLEMAQAHGKHTTALHVAIGIIEEGVGVAAAAMSYHGIVLAELKARFLKAAAAESNPASEIDTILAAASAEATAMTHPYVGTEHLLLALLSDPESPVTKALGGFGFGYAEAKALILRILDGPELPPPLTAQGQ